MLTELKIYNTPPIDVAIMKWKDILSGTGKNDGRDNCALCEKYLKHHWYIPTCFGCPISKHTGEKLCRGTPYQSYPNKYDTERMIAFLKMIKAIETDNYSEI